MWNPRMARLAGLGAWVVALVLALLYFLFARLLVPSGAGIDSIESAVARIALAAVALALILPHIYYGKVLMAVARRNAAGHD